MMDMTEFGEAAPFLRKSEKELMMLQTVAFDGELQYCLGCQWPANPDKGCTHNISGECRANQDAKPCCYCCSLSQLATNFVTLFPAELQEAPDSAEEKQSINLY